MKIDLGQGSAATTLWAAWRGDESAGLGQGCPCQAAKNQAGGAGIWGAVPSSQAAPEDREEPRRDRYPRVNPPSSLAPGKSSYFPAE